MAIAKSNVKVDLNYSRYNGLIHFDSKTIEKVKNISYNIFSLVFFPLGLYRVTQFAMHRLVGLFISQGQLTAKFLRKDSKRADYINNIKSKFLKFFDSVEEIKIKTSDNINLSSMVFQKNNAKGTIIFFGGSAYFYEGLSDCKLSSPHFPYNHALDEKLLKQASKANYNIILFNPRGTALSQGWASQEGLVKDAEALLGYAKNVLKTKNEDIVAYGHSLGAYAATMLSSKHNVKLVSDRSFSNLPLAAKHVFGDNKFGKIAYYALKFFGWNMDSIKAWNKVSEKKALLYHKLDNNVLIEASLKSAIDEKDKDKVFKMKMGHHVSCISNLYFNSIFKELFKDKFKLIS
ncbi:MAG: hypothetical protein K1060chlam5_00687 [Candidatus Anoxychlamydiales bacterium]|nr:hypothetical protein [Candidatus Anoxychlamydiales bacterium]